VRVTAPHDMAKVEKDFPAHSESGFNRIMWIQLEPFLLGQDCPVCALGHQSAERYLKSLLYEGVTDRFLRARLRRSLGLCPLHAWQAMDFREGLFADHVSMAVIYHDVIGTVVQALKEIRGMCGKPAAGILLKPRLKKTLRQLVAASRCPLTDCPACEHQRFAEESGLACLVACITDESVGRTYAEGPGLCLQHLSFALERTAGKPGFDFLLNCEIVKFENMGGLLHALQERFDVRSDARPTREEALAPAEALVKLGGRNVVRRKGGDS